MDKDQVLLDLSKAVGRVEAKVDDLGAKLDAHVASHEARSTRRTGWLQTIFAGLVGSGLLLGIFEWARTLLRRA